MPSEHPDDNKRKQTVKNYLKIQRYYYRVRIEQFVLNYNTLFVASLLTLDLSSLKKHVLLRIRW